MTDREYRNEGDKQFEKLNTEIKKLQEENRDIQQSCENYYNEMRAYKNQVADLKKQIEKMKCCSNCKYGFCHWSSESFDKDGKVTRHCWNEEKEMYCDVGNSKDAKYQLWELAK